MKLVLTLGWRITAAAQRRRQRIRKIDLISMAATDDRV
jgi:hypothetical protein